ncbi:hypothetical protein cypCar_00007264 [Cyprinus carpio]|nr:hypothetical protein cypCar_00007264 [Cyprinus carpio]
MFPSPLSGCSRVGSFPPAACHHHDRCGALYDFPCGCAVVSSLSQVCAQSCDCRAPSLQSCLDYSCPSPNCAMWDCACTCQPPECDSINCFCFEIKFK